MFAAPSHADFCIQACGVFCFGRAIRYLISIINSEVVEVAERLPSCCKCYAGKDF